MASIDPNKQVVLAIYPRNCPAYQIFCHDFNVRYYDPGSYCLNQTEAISRVASVPYRTQGEKEPSLKLRWDLPPKCWARGWVFGSNPNICDVILGRPTDGVSATEFTIEFDEHGHIIMRAEAINPISVTYDEAMGPITTDDFTFVLLPWMPVVKVRVASFLDFEIHIPSDGQQRSESDVTRGRMIHEACRNPNSDASSAVFNWVEQDPRSSQFRPKASGQP